jgi:S1-C subfamily serine protease
MMNRVNTHNLLNWQLVYIFIAGYFLSGCATNHIDQWELQRKHSNLLKTVIKNRDQKNVIVQKLGKNYVVYSNKTVIKNDKDVIVEIWKYDQYATLIGSEKIGVKIFLKFENDRVVDSFTSENYSYNKDHKKKSLDDIFDTKLQMDLMKARTKYAVNDNLSDGLALEAELEYQRLVINRQLLKLFRELRDEAQRLGDQIIRDSQNFPNSALKKREFKQKINDEFISFLKNVQFPVELKDKIQNNINSKKEQLYNSFSLRLVRKNTPKKQFKSSRVPRQPQLPSEEQSPPSQSGIGSGFFVSKLGHVITNAHVVKGCKKLTVGDNANKQVPAEIINTDKSNDLALLKLSSLEMASAESKSLIQKLSIVVVPLASKGLLRSDDVRLGEKVLVAGFPFGDIFSNTIKVTSGIVSATRGAGDDSGQFQLDAAVQPGNSGGPIYDSSGNIVGVVISQLDKLKVAKAIGSLPENVNFGIKASTVRQFLISSGLPSKKAEQTDEKSTEQLAEIAQNQALMAMCLQ